MQQRALARNENAPGVTAWLGQDADGGGESHYRLRGAVAEFANAWLKAKMDLRQFRVRGLKKVRCEALWACLSYNLRQGVRWRVQGAGEAT